MLKVGAKVDEGPPSKENINVMVYLLYKSNTFLFLEGRGGFPFTLLGITAGCMYSLQLLIRHIRRRIAHL